MTTADREWLLAIAADRNSPRKHVWRARIVLLTANGFGTPEIMRQAGVARTAVWRWQERFMQAGVEGLLRDKTRPSRIPPLTPKIVERLVALTLADPPGEATHWTAAAMEGDRQQCQFGAAHLAQPRPAAAPHAAVQALHRSEVC